MRRTNYARFVSIAFMLAVWFGWAYTQGLLPAIDNLLKHWQIAITMIFGSMVAGGTSMGGGAVAFPVLTKVLHISPYEAKLFSLAIQSIGMTSASIVILAMRIRVEWKMILWVSLGGMVGISVSILYIFPYLEPGTLKVIFSSMIGMFGIVLFLQNRRGYAKSLRLNHFGTKEKVIFWFTGLAGGIISGLVGNGIDVLSFTVMVLLFGLCEKFATPNSVILMAINALTGFFIHYIILQDFPPVVTNYWSAAVPVVVLGAPLGAIICKFISPAQLVKVLMILIFTEVLFTFLLVEQNVSNVMTFLISSGFFSIVFYYLGSSTHYKQPTALRPLKD